MIREKTIMGTYRFYVAGRVIGTVLIRSLIGTWATLAAFQKIYLGKN